jgi:hypothetical protein
MTKSPWVFSLKQMERETGITTASILLLLEHYRDSIPYKLVGAQPRFPSEAIPIIVELWREYTRGIQIGKQSDFWYVDLVDLYILSAQKLRELTDLLHETRKQIYSNPPDSLFFINSLPGTELRLVLPIAVTVELELDSEPKRARAKLIELDLEAYGENEILAVFNLREKLMRTFLRLEVQEERSLKEKVQFELLARILRRD